VIQPGFGPWRARLIRRQGRFLGLGKGFFPLLVDQVEVRLRKIQRHEFLHLRFSVVRRRIPKERATI